MTEPVLVAFAIAFFFVVYTLQKPNGGRGVSASQRRTARAVPVPLNLTPAQLSEQVEAFGRSVRDSRWALRTLGKAGPMLEHALDEEVEQPFQALAERWRHVVLTMERRQPLEERLDVIMRRVQSSLSQLEGRVQAVEQLGRDRSAPELGELLDDADAVAAAFTRPFSEFAYSRNLTFPTNHPITVPAGGGHERQWVNLLPSHPVVHVPSGFGTEMFRWMSVPHELAHVIWDKTPGLADEVQAVLGLAPTGPLGRVSDIGRVPYALASAWLPELFADWVTVIQAGPAAVHGMHHVFANPRNVDALVQVHSAGSYYDTHPPAHLRMLYMCGLLHRMGFDVESNAALDAWNQLHPHIGQISVPLADGPDVLYGAVELAAFITEYATRFYTTQLRALDGYAFDALPGFEMRPGTWHQVTESVPKLLRGASFHEDARVIVAAAIEARRKAAADPDIIMEAVREAIVGLNAPLADRRVRSGRSRRHLAGNGRFSRAEFRDALVLGDIVARRGKPIV